MYSRTGAAEILVCLSLTLLTLHGARSHSSYSRISYDVLLALKGHVGELWLPSVSSICVIAKSYDQSFGVHLMKHHRKISKTHHYGICDTSKCHALVRWS